MHDVQEVQNTHEVQDTQKVFKMSEFIEGAGCAGGIKYVGGA